MAHISKKLLCVPLLLLSLGLVYALLSGRLVASYYRVLYSDTALLSQQLHGSGCWFQYDSDRNGTCDFEWSYFKRAVRNPEYHCPMRAARCLAMSPSRSVDFLPDLKIARDALQREFDTGDGVIKYYECLDAVIRAIESTHGDRDTIPVGSLWTCSS